MSKMDYKRIAGTLILVYPENHEQPIAKLYLTLRHWWTLDNLGLQNVMIVGSRYNDFLNFLSEFQLNHNLFPQRVSWTFNLTRHCQSTTDQNTYHYYLTRYPLATSPNASCVLTVDLPTPPLPDITKITCFTFDNILFIAVLGHRFKMQPYRQNNNIKM